MYKIGLTGGIGSGKSRVADMLAEWGASVIDADEISHALTAPGGAAMPAIAREFGPQAVAADGALDRAWMRDLVFREPTARGRLEALLHPLIGLHTEQAAAQARIMAAQAARATRLEAADDVIVNDGATSPDTLRARARTLHDRWLALAGAASQPGGKAAGTPE